jgi:hypothetical protein
MPNRVPSYREREIALIREYRKKLIADVVTGKLDVRHLAPDKPFADEPADLGVVETFDNNEEEQEGCEDSLVEEGADADD